MKKHRFIFNFEYIICRYTFQQSHWHWGSTNSKGSEHHFDGLKDPMEIHLVHMNTKYSNLTEAFNHSDGIAVLAFLYEVNLVYYVAHLM